MTDITTACADCGIDSKSDKTATLHQIYFYLAQGCNLRCRHCWIDPKYQAGSKHYPVLDFDLFRLILDQASPLGLSKVKLTGGEPLLHGRIFDIIDEIRERNLTLSVETNGILCTKALSKQIAAVENAFIAISLDGANAETHEWVRGVKGSFGQAIDGIRNLIDAGVRTQIIMTVMRHNREQIIDMVKLAEKLGVPSIKFNIVQPTARGVKMHESGESLTIEELVELGKWVEEELVPKTRVELLYSHPPAFRPMHRLFRSGHGLCGLCGIKGIIGVLADGSYALCGIGETVPELIFGKAGEDDLAEVWNNHPVLNDLRRGLPAKLGGICSKCVMSGICLGNCIAQNYYRSRDLWAPYWYCEQAYEKGLFPVSRLTGAGSDEAKAR